jgi:hypothetical protein
MLLNVPELTSRTIEQLCPHELQRRVSQPISRCVPQLRYLARIRLRYVVSAAHVLLNGMSTSAAVPRRCVLLLGKRASVTAPSFPAGGFTDVMADPLQHNLAQFRQVVKRIEVGGQGKEIIGSDPPPKMVWVDREKQTELADAIDRAAAGKNTSNELLQPCIISALTNCE